MPGHNILLLLRQINVCVGLYGMDKMEKKDEMTFAQIFLLNEIFAMRTKTHICSKDLSEQMNFSEQRSARL